MKLRDDNLSPQRKQLDIQVTKLTQCTSYPDMGTYYFEQ